MKIKTKNRKLYKSTIKRKKLSFYEKRVFAKLIDSKEAKFLLNLK